MISLNHSLRTRNDNQKPNWNFDPLICGLGSVADLFVYVFYRCFLTSLPARASDQIAAANNVITSMIRDVETYLETDSGNVEKRTENIAKAS